MTLRIVIYLIYILNPIIIYGQKKPIDEEVINNWIKINDNTIVCPNGKYVAFEIENEPRGQTTTILQNIETGFESKFQNISNAKFDSQGRHFAFMCHDTLKIVNLENQNLRLIFRVSNFEFINHNLNSIIIYRIADSIILENLITDQKRLFNSVTDYTLTKDNSKLYFAQRELTGQILLRSFSFDITAQPTTIWTGGYQDKISSLTVDHQGKIAFFIKNKRDIINPCQIAFFDSHSNHLSFLPHSKIRVLKSFDIGYRLEFSQNGNSLFYSLIDTVTANPAKSGVNVWRWNDNVLQPEQERTRYNKSSFLVSYHILSKLFTILEDDTTHVYALHDNETDYVIKQKSQSVFEPSSEKVDVEIQSLLSGKVRKLYSGRRIPDCFGIFNNGRYLVYFDPVQKCFFSYDLICGVRKIISRAIGNEILSDNESSLAVRPATQTLLQDPLHKYVLFAGRNNIWRMDPTGKTDALNLTIGDSKPNLKFRLLNKAFHSLNDLILDKKLIVSAYDTITKVDGFFGVDLNGKRKPELLYMKDGHFYRDAFLYPHGGDDLGMAPVKASSAKIFVVREQALGRAPNLLYTTNFKSFNKISDIKPQRNINWMTAELIHWKAVNGKHYDGILYKPEDFDPEKKYPVILNFYEQFSQRFNDFLAPGFTDGNINIPWFVSHGYLIFTPDIHYENAAKSGKTAPQWALEAIESGANAIKQLSFVDGEHLALQGHSFGGLECAYIATHSKIFCAAMEAAGSTDPLSRYLTLIPFLSKEEHFSAQKSIESGHEQYGATPWERPDLYLQSSTVLSADKLSCPLLIMHNPNDNQVQWRQGIEFYMALRRLKKKSWMLTYDDDGHGVNDKNAKDLTKRMMQFFDHYLKGAPAPIWMTKGIPAKLKGLEDGYDLDPGVEP